MLPVGADVAMMPASPLVEGFYIRDAVTHRSAILHRLPRRHHAAAVVPAAHQPAAVLVAVKDKPFGRPQDAAVLDRHCARQARQRAGRDERMTPPGAEPKKNTNKQADKMASDHVA
jgi:hypothetical protein